METTIALLSSGCESFHQQRICPRKCRLLKDFLHVIMMKFCLRILPQYFLRGILFQVVFFNTLLKVVGVVNLAFFKKKTFFFSFLFFFSSCFWLHSTDYLEGISVMHALGNSYSCWWRIRFSRRLWGSVIYRRYLTVGMTHMRSHSDMQWITVILLFHQVIL